MLLVVIGLYIGGAIVFKNIRSSVALSAGEKFISKLYAEYSIVGGSCQGEDTDSDKYVSCDFRIRNTSGTERVVHLQCPVISKRVLGSTCKETRTVIPQ